jgi:hypothetical protein
MRFYIPAFVWIYTAEAGQNHEHKEKRGAKFDVIE